MLHAGIGGGRFTFIAVDISKPIRHNVSRHPKQRADGLLGPPIFRVGAKNCRVGQREPLGWQGDQDVRVDALVCIFKMRA